MPCLLDTLSRSPPDSWEDLLSEDEYKEIDASSDVSSADLTGPEYSSSEETSEEDDRSEGSMADLTDVSEDEDISDDETETSKLLESDQVPPPSHIADSDGDSLAGDCDTAVFICENHDMCGEGCDSTAIQDLKQLSSIVSDTDLVLDSASGNSGRFACTKQKLFPSSPDSTVKPRGAFTEKPEQQAGFDLEPSTPEPVLAKSPHEMFTPATPALIHRNVYATPNTGALLKTFNPDWSLNLDAGTADKATIMSTGMLHSSKPLRHCAAKILGERSPEVGIPCSLVNNGGEVDSLSSAAHKPTTHGNLGGNAEKGGIVLFPGTSSASITVDSSIEHSCAAVPVIKMTDCGDPVSAGRTLSQMDDNTICHGLMNKSLREGGCDIPQAVVPCRASTDAPVGMLISTGGSADLPSSAEMDAGGEMTNPSLEELMAIMDSRWHGHSPTRATRCASEANACRKFCLGTRQSPAASDGFLPACRRLCRLVSDMFLR